MGEDLTQKDKENLLEAAKTFRALNTFNPSLVTTAFGEGRCYQGIGQLEIAEANYRQAIENGKIDKSEPAQLTVPEAHFRLSQVRFQVGDYESALQEAAAAVKAHPDSPNYLEARAAALVQLKRFKEADKDLHAALALDPVHKASLALHQLVQAELHSTKP
jgi:Flp pilus assembly protein TadD